MKGEKIHIEKWGPRRTTNYSQNGGRSRLYKLGQQYTVQNSTEIVQLFKKKIPTKSGST